jgi:hypothetical protein
MQASERVSVANLRSKLTEFAQARQEFTGSLEVRDADEKRKRSVEEGTAPYQPGRVN